MLKFFERMKRVRNTRNELMSLSDRELKDIGINRSDIPRIAGRYI
jgi:uncharacterized protein YjiS (DUF1127 family)